MTCFALKLWSKLCSLISSLQRKTDAARADYRFRSSVSIACTSSHPNVLCKASSITEPDALKLSEQHRTANRTRSPSNLLSELKSSSLYHSPSDSSPNSTSPLQQQKQKAPHNKIRAGGAELQNEKNLVHLQIPLETVTQQSTG